MKTFEKQAAQGDILLNKVEIVPADAKPIKPTGGSFIVSHDAGHPHVLPVTGVQCFVAADNPLIMYARVEADDVALTHQRPFDTHEPLAMPPGVYEIRRQREWIPEGFRAVAD